MIMTLLGYALLIGAWGLIAFALGAAVGHGIHALEFERHADTAMTMAHDEDPS